MAMFVLMIGTTEKLKWCAVALSAIELHILVLCYKEDTDSCYMIYQMHKT